MQAVNGPISRSCSVAIDQYLRVIPDSTNGLALAGAEDKDLGTTCQTHIVDGIGAHANVAIMPRNAFGAVWMIAAGAIAVDDEVYGASAGRVSATANGNFIGRALSAATAAGDWVQVMRYEGLASGAEDVGGLIFFEDFLADLPAAGTAINGGMTKVETNGLGVTSSDQANGVAKFAFDAVAEAATAALYLVNAPFDIDQNPVFETKLAVYDIGDDGALDINFGLASDTHATDFDSVAVYAAFHLDGTDLSVLCQSDDGTTTVAATDSTVDLVDDTFAVFKIDASDKADVKFYINGSRVLSGTTFDISAYTGTLTPIVHVEKTSNDTTVDVRVDWIRVTSERA